MTYDEIIYLVTIFSMLSIIIERALYQIFDTKIWKKIENDIDSFFEIDYIDLKPIITIMLCVILVISLNMDIVIVIAKAFNNNSDINSTLLTNIISALFLAGGSTGVYKFFKRMREIKDLKLEKEKAETESKKIELHQNKGEL